MARGTAKEATGKQSLLLIWLGLFLLLFTPYEKQPLFAGWSVLYLSHRLRQPFGNYKDPDVLNHISKLFQSPFKARIIFLKILGFNGDNVKCVVSSFIVKGIKTKFTYVVDKTLDYVPINFLSIGN